MYNPNSLTTPVLSAVVSGTGLQITVTGAAATTIYWAASIRNCGA